MGFLTLRTVSATITCIIRIIYLAKLDYTDPTWSSAPVQLWSSLENAAGVISACIPSMMPLVLWMMGMKARPQNRRPSYFNHSSRGSRSKSSVRKRNFSRLDETTQSSTLEEVQLSTSALSQNQGDGERLVDEVKRPHETNHTVATNEASPSAPPDRQEQGAYTFTWGLRAPVAPDEEY
jgi:hypothetical protein